MNTGASSLLGWGSFTAAVCTGELLAFRPTRLPLGQCHPCGYLADWPVDAQYLVLAAYLRNPARVARGEDTAAQFRRHSSCTLLHTSCPLPSLRLLLCHHLSTTQNIHVSLSPGLYFARQFINERREDQVRRGVRHERPISFEERLAIADEQLDAKGKAGGGTKKSGGA